MHEQFIARPEICFVRTCEKVLGTVVGRRDVQGGWMQHVDTKGLARFRIDAFQPALICAQTELLWH